VTAEGVETAAQMAFLHEHGCDDVQGYLIGRPLSAAAIGAMLRAEVSLS
jgi:EAL domain-containing protein (putative c-di-GMP-specific phosphodiesterase class I)